MSLTTLDEHCALVVVDLQGGVRGLPYTHPVQEVIDRSASLARAFRERGLPVVVTVADSSHARPRRTDAGFAAPRALPEDWNVPVEELAVSEGDHLITKATWGSFAGTDLEGFLRSREVTQVVVTGVATGFGVESTARGAADRGLEVVVVTDAVTDMDAAVHECSVTRIFPRLGECATTDEVLAAIARR